MTIEKRANGNYRIVEMRNGIRYRITVDHKPTKNEAKKLLEDKIGAFSDKTVFNVHKLL